MAGQKVVGPSCEGFAVPLMGSWSGVGSLKTLVRLAVANLTRRKTRTALAVAVVGVGVMMLVLLVSLSRGSVEEVRRRFESVEAELLLTPENFAPFDGEAQLMFGDARAARIVAEARDPAGGPLVAEIIPVLIDEVVMAGQRQRVFGIPPGQWPLFAGNRRVVDGQPLDDDFTVTTAAVAELEAGDDLAETDDGWAAGRQLLIDERLARAGRRDPHDGRHRPYCVGETVRWLGAAPWRIVGIVETGVAGRVFAPLRTLRHYRNCPQGATLLFAKLASPHADSPEAIDTAEATLREYLVAKRFGLEVSSKNAYGRALLQSLRSLLLFTDVIAAVSVAVSLLVILLTVTTMVLERTGEIAILRAVGASRGQVLLEILLEAELIAVTGLAVGIAAAYGAGAMIETLYPLLTVEIRPAWLIIAAVVATMGTAAAALPAAWSAARADPAVALTGL